MTDEYFAQRADDAWRVRRGAQTRCVLDGDLAEYEARRIAAALNSSTVLDQAELLAYREMFAVIVNEHEWWQPGGLMGDAGFRTPLPDGHDHLADWAVRESRSACRRCKFEAIVAEHMSQSGENT